MASIKPGYKRKEISLPKDVIDKIAYWADNRDMTFSEMVDASTSLYIKFINEDYDLPTLEQRRLNELIESQYRIADELKQLQQTVMNTSAVLLRTTNGSNYLSDSVGDMNE